MNYRGVGKEEFLDRVRLCSVIFWGDFQLKFFSDFLAVVVWLFCPIISFHILALDFSSTIFIV